jgi:hypothetical protein
MAIYDAATVLMAHNTYASNQSFAPILIYPRQLATTMVQIHLLTPPVAACTFALEIASTQAGAYSVINTYGWPAGVSGSRQLAVGVSPSLARILNNQSAWLRMSLVTTGALTGSAWLTKPSDGGMGTGSDVHDVLAAPATLRTATAAPTPAPTTPRRSVPRSRRS